MMRRALYGRVLLLWGCAFGSQHYIDIGIDVDGGEAQLRATQSDEPQWAAMRFCETHALNASVVPATLHLDISAYPELLIALQKEEGDAGAASQAGDDKATTVIRENIS